MNQKRQGGRPVPPRRKSHWYVWAALALSVFSMAFALYAINRSNSHPTPPPAITTPIPVNQQTWTVYDPQGQIVDQGTLPADQMPASGNSCFGMQSPAYRCEIKGGTSGALVMAGMVSFPEPREDRENPVYTQPTQHDVSMNCPNGSKDHRFINLEGFGPGNAEVLNVGRIPPGEWRYIDLAGTCGFQDVVRVGYIFYPAGADRVEYHLWKEPIILR